MAVSRIDEAGLNVTQYGNRNLIINGDMQVAQRGTSETGVTGNGYFTCDRWKWDNTDSSTLDFSQSTDAPTGFGSSLKIDVTTADATVDAADQAWLNQRIEGQNLQQLKKGTSSAESLTLSFWVKSTKTGTYIAELNDSDNSRHISSSYTVSSSDTWEQKTITFSGDTTGVLDNDNSESVRIKFWLMAGSNYSSGTLATSWAAAVDANRAVGQVNALDNAANNFYLTGVQLEVGDTATGFEHRSYADELQRCQRYCQLYGEDTTVAGVVYNNDKDHYFPFRFPEIRARPSVTFSSQPSVFANDTSGANTITAGGANNDNTRSIRFQASDISIGSSGQASWFQMGAAGSYFLLEAEL